MHVCMTESRTLSESRKIQTLTRKPLKLPVLFSSTAEALPQESSNRKLYKRQKALLSANL